MYAPNKTWENEFVYCIRDGAGFESRLYTTEGAAKGQLNKAKRRSERLADAYSKTYQGNPDMVAIVRYRLVKE